MGELMTVELIADGDTVQVTDENKKDYVQRVINYKLVESIKDQIDSLRLGF